MKSKTWVWVIIAVAILALIPIWRIAGSQKGYSAIEAIYKVAFKGEHKHIPKEEAIEHATEAYHFVGAPSLN